VHVGGGCDGSVDLGKGLGKGGTRPLEGMGSGVPLGDERGDPHGEVVEIGEVGNGEALALEDREPLLDLVHPGAVDGREVHAEAGMPREPGAGELAFVGADVVADQVDEGDLGRFGALRGRGWIEVFSSRDKTRSCASSGRV